jgi:hypothetical protein
MSTARKSATKASSSAAQPTKKVLPRAAVSGEVKIKSSSRMAANGTVINPMSKALAALKKDPERARNIAIKAGIITPKTHKLTKEYA